MEKEPNAETVRPDPIEGEKGKLPLSGLALIAKKATEKPTEQFTSLLHHLTADRIEMALYKVPFDSAAGIDKVTVGMARNHLDWMLPSNLKDIHEGKYEAPKAKRIYIPKADGKQRPISIPPVVDRAIQGATKEILEAIYEQDFLNCSYGFRPGRGCHNALAAVAKFVNRGMKKILEVDIENFFGSLNHEWLEKFLSLRIGDKRILKLVKAWLKAGVMENGKPLATEEGTVQGGSISPLLANVYLHYVLDLWFEKKIRPRLKGKAELVRFADDFVITCEQEEDREEISVLLKVRLEQFGLKIAENKTHKSNLGPKGRGKENQRRRIDFLGMSIFQAKTKSGEGEKLVFKTEKKRFGRAKVKVKEKLWKLMHLPLELQSKMINSFLRGHFNYYGLPGNIERLKVFRYEVIRIWKKTLSRRSQRDGTNWEVMTEKLRKLPLIFPKLKISYGTLDSYLLLGKR